MQQENDFWYQKDIESQETLQLWVEDHRRVTEANQALTEQLNGQIEAAECWMSRMEEEKRMMLHNKDQELEQMREMMRIQQEEIRRLSQKNHSLKVLIKVSGEEEKEQQEAAAARLRNSKEEKEAMRIELEELRKTNFEKSKNKSEARDLSITEFNHITKLKGKAQEELERIKKRLEARRKQKEQCIDKVKSQNMIMSQNRDREAER